MMTQQSSVVQKPTVVLVAGACHVPAHYEPLCIELQALGYPTLTIQPRTTGEDATTFSYRDDVKLIQGTLRRLIQDEEKDVVLAPHSLGCVTASQSVTGLEKSRREAEGTRGGLLHVVFIAGLLAEQNKRLMEALGSLPPWLSYDASSKLLRPGDVIPWLFNKLSPPDAAHYASILQPVTAIPQITDAGTVCFDLDVPITYVLPKDDAMRSQLESMMSGIRRKRWLLQEIEGDHGPFLSNIAGLIKVIEASAGQ